MSVLHRLEYCLFVERCQFLIEASFILPIVDIHVILFFPYFLEPQMTRHLPGLLMSDYKVNYSNHSGYRGGVSGRSRGSPARIFTDVPLNELVLPPSQGYRSVCWNCDWILHTIPCCICMLVYFYESCLSSKLSYSGNLHSSFVILNKLGISYHIYLRI